MVWNEPQVVVKWLCLIFELKAEGYQHISTPIIILQLLGGDDPWQENQNTTSFIKPKWFFRAYHVNFNLNITTWSFEQFFLHIKLCSGLWGTEDHIEGWTRSIRQKTLPRQQKRLIVVQKTNFQLSTVTLSSVEQILLPTHQKKPLQILQHVVQNVWRICFLKDGDGSDADPPKNRIFLYTKIPII